MKAEDSKCRTKEQRTPQGKDRPGKTKVNGVSKNQSRREWDSEETKQARRGDKKDERINELKEKRKREQSSAAEGSGSRLTTVDQQTRSR